MKNIFEVNIQNNTPIVATDFYKWLQSEFDYGKYPEWDEHDIAVINRYLVSLGFDNENQLITEEALKYLQIVVNHYFDCRAMNAPAKLSELFDFEHIDENGSYIVGIGRKDLTKKGLQYLKNCNMIEVDDGVYFEVRYDILFAGYNCIAGGSRKVCELIPE